MAKAKTRNSTRPSPFTKAAVVPLALAGYLVLLIFPLLTLALAALLPFSIHSAAKATDWLAVGLEFALLGVCAWITFDILRLRPSRPSGQPLARERYSALWNEVDRLCAAYGTAPVDHLLLTRHFDMELERTPTFGYPARHVTTISIGLPLMQAVSKEHLTVLLARKISQVPRSVNWPVAWLYQLRMTWFRYARDYPRTASLGNMLMGFWFSWYSPLYIRVTRTVARECELDADRDALEVFSVHSVEEAITSYTVRKSFVENKLWPALLRMAGKYPRPPFLPFRRMEALISKELDADRAHRLLDGLLHSKALSDTHFPTLGMRWRALTRNRPRVPEPVNSSAAQQYLHGSLRQIVDFMDRLWLKTNLGDWKKRHEQGQKERTRLDRLLEQLPQELLSTDELWECTLLVKQYMGQQKAVSLYKALLETAPRDARIYYKIGSFLLSCRDEAGVRALEQAMNMDGKYTTDACEAISEFMHFTGERRQARSYQQRAVQFDAA